MSIHLETIPWFSGSKRILEVNSAPLVIGGTHLLGEFLAAAASFETGGQLKMVTPFLDEDVFHNHSIFRPEAARRFDVALLSTRQTAYSAAAKHFASLPWKTCEIRAVTNLHAKLYVVQPVKGWPLGLVGSHNLTGAAVGRNHEAGVLLTGSTPDAILSIAAMEDYVQYLRDMSMVVHDSLKWPMALAGGLK